MTSSPSKKIKTDPSISLSSPQTNRSSTVLPQHLIFISILPLLSYKSLSKFKCVCKAWYEIISNDAKFAEDQSLCASPISCGAVFSNCCGNKFKFFNTFGSPIGFDQCQHLFAKHKFYRRRRILSSSCGLLCILLHKFSYSAYLPLPYYLYVGNLATGVGEVIFLSDGGFELEYNVGLAFDPLIEPNCYRLVQPLYHSDHLFDPDHEAEYEFDVYSSKLCQWVRSEEKIRGIKSFKRHRRPVTLKNIIYWDCYEYIISFDPWNDVASYIELPKHDESWYSQDLGTWNERITCTRMDKKSMKVYVLDEREKTWEMKHNVSLDIMFNSNQDLLLEFWHSLGKTSNRFLERVFLVYKVNPFPYGGGSKLFFRVSTKKSEFVFSYDLKSGKVARFSEFQVMDSERGRGCDEYGVFMYHNSMVKFPVCQENDLVIVSMDDDDEENVYSYIC